MTVSSTSKSLVVGVSSIVETVALDMLVLEESQESGWRDVRDVLELDRGVEGWALAQGSEDAQGDGASEGLVRDMRFPVDLLVAWINAVVLGEVEREVGLGLDLDGSEGQSQFEEPFREVAVVRAKLVASGNQVGKFNSVHKSSSRHFKSVLVLGRKGAKGAGGSPFIVVVVVANKHTSYDQHMRLCAGN
jgi:hypothetical protein